MNIVNRLTIRQLRLNKKRTLVTIIGAIISVAMITAVATLGISFMNLMQRQAIADEGEWHVVYPNVNQDQIKGVKADKETKDILLFKELGYAPLEESKNPNKPYLFLSAYNTGAFMHLPIELKEGRLPKAVGELVISEAIQTNGGVNYKIGDVISLNLGQRSTTMEDGTQIQLNQYDSLIRGEEGKQETLTQESTQTFTIVGMIKRPILEPTGSPGYTVLTYADESSLAAGETTNLLVLVKQLDKSLFDHAKKVAQKNGIEVVDFNSSLLRYYGLVNDDKVKGMLDTLTVIIMGIIMIGSISLIYNAFAISVSERSRYLGMLSSVGATKKQKRNSVFFEGAVIGAISIPIGLLAGLGGIAITFLCINPIVQGAFGVTERFKLLVSPLSMIVAVLVSISTIILSTYIPARRASRVSAIDAIRQTQDVKFTSKTVKTSTLTRKLFGIEGELGLKNLKRYRARYKATVFSLVISIILFLVVNSFTASLKKSIELSQEGINYDLGVYTSGGDLEQSNKMMKQVLSLTDITAFTQIDTFSASTWVKEEEAGDFLKKDLQGLAQNGQFPYTVYIQALDDQALKSYAKEVGVNVQLLMKTDKPLAIVIDTVKYKDNNKDKYVEAKSIKTREGKSIDLIYYDGETNKDVPLVSTLKIGALTDIMPMGILSQGSNPALNLVVSKAVLEELLKANPGLSQNVYTNLYMNSDKPLKLQEEIEALNEEGIATHVNVDNVYLNRLRAEQIVVIMSIFTYAFIILITTICVANIMNTISTSMALRKREFAMMKSVGMTAQGFNRMIRYESIFYGLKALLYGLPISVGLMLIIHKTLMAKFSFTFEMPWGSIFVAIASVFIIVSMTMLYASAKVKRDNIIEVLRQEII